MTLRRLVRPLIALSAAIAAGFSLAPLAQAGETKVAKPIRALLVSGGGYHDYSAQKKILPEGVSARANVEWTVINDTNTQNDHKIPLFEDPKWADGYDIVVHNECYADVTDPEYIGKILAAHKNGTPGIVIHCAMHTFRALKTDDWREFLGVSTFRHGKQHPLDVKVVTADHPIMKGFPSQWITGNEELYQIDKVWPGTTVLAQAKAEDGNKKDNAVMWVHTYGKGKVFGTTIAHNNKTMADGVYLDTFTRGLLWATDKLDEDGKPKPGYGPTTTAKAD
jgi:type 1 glutamine amidotransferase